MQEWCANRPQIKGSNNDIEWSSAFLRAKADRHTLRQLQKGSGLICRKCREIQLITEIYCPLYPTLTVQSGSVTTKPEWIINNVASYGG